MQIEVLQGTHSITAAEPLGIYSFGVGTREDNFDAYGTGAGQMLKVTPSY